MTTLTRPEGTDPRDLDLTRRGLAALLAAGYAAFATDGSARLQAWYRTHRRAAGQGIDFTQAST